MCLQSQGISSMVCFVSTGVHPTMQGRGLSNKLRRSVTAQCDVEGRHCYAEANNRLSKHILEKPGFRQIGEPYRPSKDVPWLYPMARPPAKLIIKE